MTTRTARPLINHLAITVDAAILDRAGRASLRCDARAHGASPAPPEDR